MSKCTSRSLRLLAYPIAIFAYRSLDYWHARSFATDSWLLSTEIFANCLTYYHGWPIVLNRFNYWEASSLQKETEIWRLDEWTSIEQKGQRRTQNGCPCDVPRNWLRWTAYYGQISERHVDVWWESWFAVTFPSSQQGFNTSARRQIVIERNRDR